MQPLVQQNWRRGQLLDPAVVAGEWADQFAWHDERPRRKLAAELAPAAAHFLLWLEAEIQKG